VRSGDVERLFLLERARLCKGSALAAMDAPRIDPIQIPVGAKPSSYFRCKRCSPLDSLSLQNRHRLGMQPVQTSEAVEPHRLQIAVRPGVPLGEPAITRSHHDCFRNIFRRGGSQTSREFLPACRLLRLATPRAKVNSRVCFRSRDVNLASADSNPSAA